MNRGVFFALVNFSALLIVAILMVELLSPFLSALAWAGVIALSAHPLYVKLLGWFGGRKNIAATITTTLLVLLVATPLVALTILLTNETVVVIGKLQEASQEGRIPGKEQILGNPFVSDVLEKVDPYIKDIDFKPVLTEGMKVSSSLAVGLSKLLFKNIFSFFFQFALMVVVLFFAVRDGEAIASNFWSVVPLTPKAKGVIVDTLKRVISAVLYGIILTCFIQGVLGGIGFALAGLPSSVFFGAVMVLCAFIPVVGTALVWVPGALYLFAVGKYGACLFLVLWGTVVVSFVDNIFRPLFISGKSKIPLVVVALGVLGGLVTFGFLGVIMGPLLFAVSLELFRIYREDIFPTRNTPSLPEYHI